MEDSNITTLQMGNPERKLTLKSTKIQQEDETSSDSEDVEMGTFVPEIDLSKYIYDLKELKPVMKQMYFSKREFIRYGYRAHPNMTFGMCTKTLVMCHCETGNVWSHLLSAIYFIYQLVLVV